MSFFQQSFSLSEEEEGFFDSALQSPLLLHKLFAQIANPGDPWPPLQQSLSLNSLPGKMPVTPPVTHPAICSSLLKRT